MNKTEADYFAQHGQLSSELEAREQKLVERENALKDKRHTVSELLSKEEGLAHKRDFRGDKAAGAELAMITDELQKIDAELRQGDKAIAAEKAEIEDLRKRVREAFAQGHHMIAEELTDDLLGALVQWEDDAVRIATSRAKVEALAEQIVDHKRRAGVQNHPAANVPRFLKLAVAERDGERRSHRMADASAPDLHEAYISNASEYWKKILKPQSRAPNS